MQGPIVVGTDGSPSSLNAVDEAGRLAAREGVAVHVVSAYRATVPVTALAVPEAGAMNAIDHRPRAEQALGSAVQRLRSHGVTIETHAIAGGAADAIIEVAETHRAGLVVVGSRGMRGAARRVVGSVPNTVTHRAPCSVLVVRTD